MSSDDSTGIGPAVAAHGAETTSSGIDRARHRKTAIERAETLCARRGIDRIVSPALEGIEITLHRQARPHTVRIEQMKTGAPRSTVATAWTRLPTLLEAIDLAIKMVAAGRLGATTRLRSIPQRAGWVLSVRLLSTPDRSEPLLELASERNGDPPGRITIPAGRLDALFEAVASVVPLLEADDGVAT